MASSPFRPSELLHIKLTVTDECEAAHPLHNACDSHRCWRVCIWLRHISVLAVLFAVGETRAGAAILLQAVA